MMRQWTIGLGLAGVLFFVVGCAKSGTEPTGIVNGTVTYNGEPIDKVSVGFLSESGRPAAGFTDASGKFTLSTFEPGDGAVAGQHKVVISEPTDMYAPFPGTPEYEEYDPVQRFPEKYGSAETSGFTATVESGETNEFTFNMID